jgi:putative MFS transporter
LTIDEVINKYISKDKQRKLLYLSFFAWIIVAYGVMLGTFTLGEVGQELGRGGEYLIAFLKSSVFIGMLIGAFTSGLIADVFGRKYAMNLYLVTSVLFTFFGGFIHSLPVFIVLRMIAGFGYGGLMPSVNAYLSETISISIRGRYLVFLESMWAVGSILVGVVDLTLGKLSWRWDYWMMGFGFLLLIPYLLVKESPRFVFLKKGKKALEELIQAKIDEEIEEIKKVKVPVAELLKPPYLKRTLMIWTAWFVLSVVYYGIFLWLPTIFASRGIIERAIWLTFLMMVFQLAGYLSAAYFIEKIGRVKSLSIYLFGTGISALGFALISSTPLYITMAFLTSVFCLGAWGIVYAYTPELYPTSFRTTGNGSAGTITRVGGIIAPYITVLFKSTSVSLLFFSLISILSGLLVLFLGVETKGREIS